MTGFLIATGTILLIGIAAWMAYVYVADPDILERVSARVFRFVVFAGATGLILVVAPTMVSRGSITQASTEPDVVTVREVCDNLWAQFLESHPDDQFVLLAIYNKECAR